MFLPTWVLRGLSTEAVALLPGLPIYPGEPLSTSLVCSLVPSMAHSLPLTLFICSFNKSLPGPSPCSARCRPVLGTQSLGNIHPPTPRLAFTLTCEQAGEWSEEVCVYVTHEGCGSVCVGAARVSMEGHLCTFMCICICVQVLSA